MFIYIFLIVAVDYFGSICLPPFFGGFSESSIITLLFFKPFLICLGLNDIVFSKFH